MPTGLVALLDDVAAITKLAAASLDDVTAAAGKAGSKAMGVVVDDAAVTPRYMVGFSPKRELPMIWRIALGSFRNKLLFILPAALALSAFAPWLLTPLLMLGGTYLCFEGAEKVLEAFGGGHAAAVEEVITDPQALEDSKVGGAVRTDFILSAEIMVIALSEVADKPIWEQAIVLAVVGIAITIGVYGVVALIVKMDDIGLHLAERLNAGVQAIGRGLVKGMPIVMRALSIIGTAAMIWVGGGIIVHGIEGYGLTTIPHLIHDAAEGAAAAVAVAKGAVAWAVNALGAGIIGMILGSAVAGVVHLIHKARGKH
jgi:predicted DNA repair protein MutK